VDANSLIPLAVVLGPTGTGKSELAIHIAQALGGEVVNCDSLQLYRGFDIGTAKVPMDLRGGVPHHLIDVLEPTELFTAGEYARAARKVLWEIAGREHIPVVVGGTGFYLRALLEGLFPGPPRDEAIRTRLQLREGRRPGSLHRILSRLDPAAASRIHTHDKNKTIRALEVRILEGKPISALFGKGRTPLRGFRPIKLGLDPPREQLYQRLDARAIGIFERGLIEEVRQLLAAGVLADAKPFESLGYKQALQVLEGRLSQEQALQSTQLETRRYAKRQLTWFRKEPDVHWLHGFGDDTRVQETALSIIAQGFPASNRNPVVNNL
jgi:tRNA dimethylallyltransferase